MPILFHVYLLTENLVVSERSKPLTAARFSSDTFSIKEGQSSRIEQTSGVKKDGAGNTSAESHLKTNRYS